MIYAIEEIRIIDEGTIKKLKSIGIFNTGDFIEVSDNQRKRLLLSTKNNITLSEIELIATISDLVRIKGVGIKTAINLAKIENLRSVQNIAQYNNALNNELNDFLDFQFTAPLATINFSKNRLLNIAKEASKLKPKIFFENKYKRKELRVIFLSQLKKEFNTSFKFSIRTSLIAFDLIVSFILIFLPVFINPMYQNYKTLNEIYKEHLYVEFALSAFWLQVIHLLVVSGIILSALLLYFILSDIIQRKYNIIIYQILFRKEILQRAYIEHNYHNLIASYKKSSKSLLFLAILFLCSVFAIFYIDSSQGFNRLIIPIILFLLLSILLLYSKSFSFYKKLRKLRKASKEVYLRIQFAKQLEALFAIIKFIIALNVIFPLTFVVIQRFEEELMLDLKQKHYEETIQTINFEKVDSDLVPELQKTIKSIYMINSSIIDFDSGFGAYRGILHENSELINALMWAVVIALFLAFIIPYYSFSNLRSGITFFFIIGISIFVNSIIEKNFGQWFFIEENQITRYFFVLIFSFWFAIFFDWFYNILSFNKVECINCEYLIDKHVNYCSNCGLLSNTNQNAY